MMLSTNYYYRMGAAYCSPASGPAGIFVCGTAFETPPFPPRQGPGHQLSGRVISRATTQLVGCCAASSSAMRAWRVSSLANVADREKPVSPM
jgi:hypothetical protein